MKKKLSKYELLLLLTISVEADITEFAKADVDSLSERDLAQEVAFGSGSRVELTPKGQSFVKSLLKVKMPKQVWR